MASVDARLQPAIEGIVALVHPEAVLLFGSRARGDSDETSDWDLFVVLPDDAPPGDRQAVRAASGGGIGGAPDPRRGLPSWRV